jgi:hypothetical protein
MRSAWLNTWLNIGQLKQKSDMSRLHETSWHFLLENMIVERTAAPVAEGRVQWKEPVRCSMRTVGHRTESQANLMRQNYARHCIAR